MDISWISVDISWMSVPGTLFLHRFGASGEVGTNPFPKKIDQNRPCTHRGAGKRIAGTSVLADPNESFEDTET